MLEVARQPYCRWLACPVTDRELEQAYLANALFDAHHDDPEFGYRLLADEARDAGHVACDRTMWARCAEGGLVVGVRQEARDEGRQASWSARPR